MKKFEIIREIFEIVLRVGFNDDKQDAISGYTRDKMNNPVYVKKVNIDNLGQVESIAITALESDFSDACDSDIRIAFKANIGKRVILYANEVETCVLLEIRDYLRSHFGINEDEYAYKHVMNCLDMLGQKGIVSLPNKELKYILDKYYETFIKNL